MCLHFDIDTVQESFLSKALKAATQFDADHTPRLTAAAMLGAMGPAILRVSRACSPLKIDDVPTECVSLMQLLQSNCAVQYSGHCALQ